MVITQKNTLNQNYTQSWTISSYSCPHMIRLQILKERTVSILLNGWLQEAQLAGAQNELARVLLFIEQENKQLKEQTMLLDEEKGADLVREKEVKVSEAGLKRLEAVMTRKLCQVDGINTRLAEISQKTQVT